LMAPSSLGPFLAAGSIEPGNAAMSLMANFSPKFHGRTLLDAYDSGVKRLGTTAMPRRHVVAGRAKFLHRGSAIHSPDSANVGQATEGNPF
jgi:hypothetical protein